MDVLVVVLILGVVLAAAVGLRVLLVTGRAAQRGRERAARAVGDGEQVLRQGTATSFGQQSLGPAQVRGAGTLVLTDEALVFALWLPARTLRIPRAAVLGVDTARSHLAKTRGTLLLRVHWRTADGDDTIAWQVEDLDGWLDALGGARAQ